MGSYTTHLAPIQEPTRRKLAAALQPGQRLAATRAVDSAKAAHTVTVCEPETGTALGQLAGDARAHVLRAWQEHRGIEVRVSKVTGRGLGPWRKVTVGVAILTVAETGPATSSDRPQEAV